jgi:hypothetical protein
MYLDRTATHLVLQRSGSSESYREVAVFKVNVQPASGESVALSGGIYGKTFTGYTTYSGLNIGDAVTLSGTTTHSGMFYTVRAVKDYSYSPFPYFEATLILPEV